MINKQILTLLTTGVLIFTFTGCDTQANNSEPPEASTSDMIDVPTTNEVETPPNTLLPDPNIGQGLPSDAVPWANSDSLLPPEGEATSGHNPNNTPWTNWSGIER